MAGKTRFIVRDKNGEIYPVGQEELESIGYHVLVYTGSQHWALSRAPGRKLWRMGVDVRGDGDTKLPPGPIFAFDPADPGQVARANKLLAELNDGKVPGH